MKNIIDKIKNLFGQQPKSSELENALNVMRNELSKAEQEAEAMYGEKFFPEEKTLSPEEAHYNTLELAKNTDFEEIRNQYQNLKKQYNLEQYTKDEEEYKKYSELNARLDYAYEYFKHKFNID